MKMITSDAHKGIQYAISLVFPEVPWQRCQVHFSRNIIDKVPKRCQEGLRTELREMFACETLEKARDRRDEILNDYREVAENAMECLEKGFDSAMTVMIFSQTTRKALRSSNPVSYTHLKILVGHNTDYEGFLYAASRAGIDFEGKGVLILGTGCLLYTSTDRMIKRRPTSEDFCFKRAGLPT